MNTWPKKTGATKKLRWALPAVVTTLAISSGLLPTTFAATNTNTTVAPTPKMLLGQVLSSKVLPLSGTLQLNSHLGLSSLISSLGGGQSQSSSALSLLSGSHSIRVWENGPKLFRGAISSPLAETDIIRNNSSLWLWNSKSFTATHINLASKASSSMSSSKDNKTMMPTSVLATKLLSHLSSTATVKVLGPTQIAGQNAYVLSVSPNAPSSLISSIQVGIDQANGMVLKVSVLAKGAATPAFSIGFSSISFNTPSASSFSFVPPQHSKVKQVTANPSQKIPPKKNYSGPMAKSHLGLQVFNKGFGTTVASLPIASLPPQSMKMIQMLSTHGQLVTGTFGTGRLVTTSLINILTTHGYIFVGPVNAASLETAAASKF